MLVHVLEKLIYMRRYTSKAIIDVYQQNLKFKSTNKNAVTIIKKQSKQEQQFRGNIMDYPQHRAGAIVFVF